MTAVEAKFGSSGQLRPTVGANQRQGSAAIHAKFRVVRVDDLAICAVHLIKFSFVI